ncbi:hypothetical protein NE619_19005, partial [Anaerovorax odorimutans]
YRLRDTHPAEFACAKRFFVCEKKEVACLVGTRIDVERKEVSLRQGPRSALYRLRDTHPAEFACAKRFF